jgi:hypothetical protein
MMDAGEDGSVGFAGCSRLYVFFYLYVLLSGKMGIGCFHQVFISFGLSEQSFGRSAQRLING